MGSSWGSLLDALERSVLDVGLNENGPPGQCRDARGDRQISLARVTNLLVASAFRTSTCQ